MAEITQSKCTGPNRGTSIAPRVQSKCTRGDAVIHLELLAGSDSFSTAAVCPRWGGGLHPPRRDVLRHQPNHTRGQSGSGERGWPAGTRGGWGRHRGVPWRGATTPTCLGCMAAGQGDEFSPIQVEQSTGLNGSHAVKQRSSHCQGHQVRWEGASIRRQRAGSQRGAVALGNPPPQSTLLAMQGGTFSERYGGWVGLKRRERAQQETGRGGNGLGRLRSAHSGKGTGGGPGSVAGCVPSPEEDRDARLEELGKNTEGKTPSGKTPTQPNPYAPEVGGGDPPTHPLTFPPSPPRSPKIQ